MTYQICFKLGYTAHICYEEYDNFNYAPPIFYQTSGVNNYSGIDAYAPGAAFVANYEWTIDDGWYLDNGVTHHLTNNMENMHLIKEYKGTDILIISNGKGLPISHVGHIFLTLSASNHTPTLTYISLKDMLLVPAITKSLLSISKLTYDYPLSVEFCGNICLVKDMKRQVLLQGLAEKGFYKLLLKSNCLPSSYISYLSFLQLNKPSSMLSFSNVSFISQNRNVFIKTCYHSISNHCNQ